MKAVVIREFGPPQSHSLEERAPLVPSLGQVRVKVHAAGVSFVDALLTEGKYQLRPDLPFTPGTKFSGEVVEVGEGVQSLTVGTLVCGGQFGGAFAEELLVAEEMVMPLPAGVSLVEATMLTCAR